MKSMPGAFYHWRWMACPECASQTTAMDQDGFYAQVTGTSSLTILKNGMAQEKNQVEWRPP